MRRSELFSLVWENVRLEGTPQLVLNGVDLYRVKELSGHGTIEITQRHAHLAPHTLAEAVEVLL